MRSRTRRLWLRNLLAISFLAIGSSPVFGQGGTGKLPAPKLPPMRMPPGPRIPPPRRDPVPERKQVRTDVYVVPATVSGLLSITDRLPEKLGQLKRNKLETDVSDYTKEDHGAVEVLRAEYEKDVLIFLSRFQDAAGANKTMQAFGKNVAGSHNTLSRKHLKNRSGQNLGEFWLLKSSGKERKAYLLVTNGNHLYRVYGNNSDDVQKVFKSLPLQ